ncbi:MAG: peptidoglycan recognition family protein [Pyrinomonadaceae bacterium]
MPPPFRQVNRAQFSQLLEQFNFTRQINVVHFHHTSSPRHRDFNGHASVVSMFRHHTQNRGFRDIAQHITIAPDGTIFLGRNWNLAPASAVGFNTGANRPFMFETVGDFNIGEDPFRDPQKLTVLTVIKLVQRRFGLPSTALRFHREMANTDCPGSSLNKDTIIQAVNALQIPPNIDEDTTVDLLSAAELERNLTKEEITSTSTVDLAEILREFEAAGQTAVAAEDETTADEEDNHEEVTDKYP